MGKFLLDASKQAIAYIDGANLHKGISALGWKLDYTRFRSWIRQKYGINQAKLFIGLMPKHADLYTSLRIFGYLCVFKEVVYDGDGRAKGNCDADLVLHAVKDYYEHNVRSVILVSSDGDYSPLIRFWQDKKIYCTILSPAPIKKCSWLLRKTNVPIVCLDDVRSKLMYHQNEKAPGTDVSVQGPLSW
ncbi:MAG: NYN domain-containing protein [Patescibacteria group bacterium]